MTFFERPATTEEILENWGYTVDRKQMFRFKHGNIDRYGKDNADGFQPRWRDLKYRRSTMKLIDGIPHVRCLGHMRKVHAVHYSCEVDGKMLTGVTCPHTRWDS